MKKLTTFILMSTALITGTINAQNGCSTTPLLDDPLTTQNGWTIVDNCTDNGTILFTNNNIQLTKLEGTVTPPSIMGLSNSVQSRAYKSLGQTLDNAWKAECVFNLTGGNGPGYFPIVLTAGNSDPLALSGNGFGTTITYTTTNQDAIYALIAGTQPSDFNTTPFSGGTWRLYGGGKKGTLLASSANSIAIPNLNTTYRLVLERLTTGNCTLSLIDVGTNSNVAGSPICFTIDPTITGLNTIQTGVTSWGSSTRSIEGTLDNYKIWSCNAQQLNVTSNATNNSICPNTSVTLTASPVRGSQSSCSYRWMPGNLTGSSITVSPAAATTYTVTANCPCPVTGTITINILPLPNIGISPASQSICQGTTLYLKGSGSWDGWYNLDNNKQWFNMNDSPLGIPITPPVGRTTYTLVAWGANGCNNTASATYTVNPQTTINPDFGLTGNITSGNTFKITATPVSVVDGFWWQVMETDGSGNEVSGTKMENPSNWWVQNLRPALTFPGYCCNASVSTGDGVFRQGHTYRITRGTWGTCAPWASISKTITMCTNCRGNEPLFIVKDDPDYKVNQPAIAQGVPALVSSVQTMADISLYPNPTNANITIDFKNKLLNENVILSVYDYTGKAVINKSISPANGTYTIDAANLASGIYNINLHSKSVNYSGKFIKN